MGIAERMDFQALIEPTVVGMGYELVALERIGRGLLRVYIDKPDGIDIDDCVRVSNQLTRVFTVENVDYDRLEVSSPGIDRPLVKSADFVRFAGERAKVKLRLPVEGQRNFVGALLGLEGETLRLRVDETTEVALPLAEIESARLAPEILTGSKGSPRRKR
jgi:ribosome maturation factor RimP